MSTIVSVAVAVAVVVVGSTACTGDDEVGAAVASPSSAASADLTVGWATSEGHPGCVYDAATQTVEATMTVDGRAPRGTTVTVTVTAYADENTSRPVGSGSRGARVGGSVHRTLTIGFPVDEPPLVDVDGGAACARTVTY